MVISTVAQETILYLPLVARLIISKAGMATMPYPSLAAQVIFLMVVLDTITIQLAVQQAVSFRTLTQAAKFI